MIIALLIAVSAAATLVALCVAVSMVKPSKPSLAEYLQRRAAYGERIALAEPARNLYGDN